MDIHNYLNTKKDHDKFNSIEIYPAEEISTESGAHVLAYGIHKEIPSGLTFEEVIDEVKKQNGITSAPHPFSLLDALREKSENCDLIEVFNSNNVDIISNARATNFALEKNKVKVAGSDSHVITTLGRCVNEIDCENNIDDVLCAIKHGQIQITQTGYALEAETLEHLKYKINNSRDFLVKYIKNHYPNSEWMLSLLLKLYSLNQNSYLWSLLYKLSIYLMKRISKKINFQNQDPSFLHDRNLATMFKMAI